jgi:septum formation protein
MDTLLNLRKKKIVLASKSPRRQELLKGLQLEFTIRTKEVDETFPDHLKKEQIVLYLAQKKAEAYRADLQADELLITADTIVWVNDRVLNKAGNKEEALEMLRLLNGSTHQVYTGVSVMTAEKSRVFYDVTDVTFDQLGTEEMEYYVDVFRPFDKAGAYGIQEYIGFIGIKSILGSYFNVVGLPVQKLYQVLKELDQVQNLWGKRV